MSRTNQLGMIFEPGWDCFTPMSVSLLLDQTLGNVSNGLSCLYKFHHLAFLLLITPFMEGFEIREDQCVTVVSVTRAVRLFRRRGLVREVIAMGGER